MIRESIANLLLNLGRSVGRTVGLELAVEVSKHDITIRMVNPSKCEKDWDHEMFQSGNLFYDGYANGWRPFRPEINKVSSAEEPDEITIEPQPTADPKEIDEDGKTWVGMKSSKAYVTTLEQDNYAQLMNPRERWTMLLWGMVAIGVLGFFQIIITLYATGSFA